MTNPSQSLGKMPQQTIVNLGQVNGGKIQTLQTCKVSIVLLIPVIYYKNISHTFFFLQKRQKGKLNKEKKHYVNDDLELVNWLIFYSFII